MAEPPVSVGHDDGKEGRECPEQEGREEVGYVRREVHLLGIVGRVEVEKGEGFEEGNDVGGRGEEEENNKEDNVDDDNLDDS